MGCGVCIPRLAALALCCLPSPPNRGFMLGVLRAKEEKASEAAPNKLPRLREGGLDGSEGGAEDSIGVIGSDVMSTTEVEGEMVVTMA